MKYKMLEPLHFDDSAAKEGQCETKCLLCEDSFNLSLCLPVFLKHVFEVHRLIIEDPQSVCDISRYIAHWREKFTKNSIESIIPVISITPSDSKYFVLSTLLKEDKELRHQLRLDTMLKVQEQERNDEDFNRICLFCKLNFKGKRHDYLEHLARDHNMRLGNPQNLVYVDELLNRIEEKLQSLQCLYCEKTFPDRTTLKEHMRKKQHKRINPSHCTYDKYYAVNYLDPDRKWRSADKVDFDSLQQPYEHDNSDEEYNDWNEAETCIICLFCTFKDIDMNKLCLHMSSKHNFNFYVVSRHLDFYQKVKLVNYIRRQVHNSCCIYCNSSHSNSESLEVHMQTEKHHCLPDLAIYDQPEFYFSTFENDSFLYFLEDIDN